MKVLHSIGKVVNAAFDYSAKVRTIDELNRLSDYQLEDIGLSRDQLNLKLMDAWANDGDAAMPKADADKVALTDAVDAPKKESGFGLQLVSLYSAWNRPSYIV